MNNKNILSYLLAHPRFMPTIFAIFIGSVLLLFLQNLEYNIKTYLIPSIFVYAMATALLGTFHRLLALHYFRPKMVVKTDGDGKKFKIVEFEIKNEDDRNGKKRCLSEYNEVEVSGDLTKFVWGLDDNETPIPESRRIFIGILHVLLFAMFLWYNFHHHSLSW